VLWWHSDRIWGSDGQEALSKARVCLLNASALGSEVLKNLVLPGIGSFTVVDGKKVTENDLGSHFFVTANSLGSSRAQVFNFLRFSCFALVAQTKPTQFRNKFFYLFVWFFPLPKKKKKNITHQGGR
jgi:molybdopterin/thiamine biosynthesis adenylyltransferase